VVADTTVQKGIVSKGGVLVGTRREINFIEGANVTMTITDDAANNRINCTINGSAGGSQTPWTSDIQAAGFLLHKTGGIGIGAQSGNASPSTGISIYGAAHFDALNQINTSANGYAGCNFQNDVGHTLNWRVQGSARAAPDVAQITVNSCNLEILRDTAKRIIITANGVGIGTPATTAPQAALHVSKGANDVDAVVISGAENTKYMIFQANATGGRILHWNGTGMGNIMLCPSGGNVGIFTTAPICKLDIVVPNVVASDSAYGGCGVRIGRGIDNVNRAILFGISDTENLGWIQTVHPGVGAINCAINPLGGQVGIGLAVATYKLHVAGPGTVEAASVFTPSLNRSNSIAITDTTGAGGVGGALILGYSGTQFCAIRAYYANGAGWGEGAMNFFVRIGTAQEALTCILSLNQGGQIAMPILQTNVPNAGSKVIWADPADGYRLKWAA
jgi:hypothetical protein